MLATISQPVHNNHTVIVMTSSNDTTQNQKPAVKAPKALVPLALATPREFDIYHFLSDRSDIMFELCEAYDSLALLSCCEWADSVVVARVMRPINRFFEIVNDCPVSKPV